MSSVPEVEKREGWSFFFSLFFFPPLSHPLFFLFFSPSKNIFDSLSFQPDATGRVSLSFIRHGRPVPGLGPGSLLAASPDLDRAGGVFARAVVLVTEHGGRRGTRGVILSRPLGELDEDGEEGNGEGQGGSKVGGALSFFGVGGGGNSKKPSTGATLRHFLGGPVGMPGDGPRPEVAVLHGVPDVPGARRLLPRGLSSKKGRGALGGGDADAPPDPRSLLFEGGGLVDVVRAAARSAAKAAAGKGRGGGAGGGVGGVSSSSGDDDSSSSASADADAAAAAAARASSLAAALAASAARATVPPFVESSSYPPEGALKKRRPTSALSKGSAAAAGAAASSSPSSSSGAPVGRWKGMFETVDPAAVPPRIVERKERNKKKEAGPGRDARKTESGGGDGDDDGLLARLSRRRRRGLFPSRSPSSSSSSSYYYLSRQPRTVVHVYHGAAAWAAGQLEGELRAGAWGLVPTATAADVLDGSPEDLWGSLVSSGRLTWLARR